MLAALAWAAVGVLSGGFVAHVGGWSIGSRSPVRPLLLAAVLGAVALWLLGPASFKASIAWIAGDRSRRAGRIAIVLAVATFVVATAWNSRAVGGSDSSCYALQADAFASGHVALPPVLPDLPPGVTAAAMAPIGFIPSPTPPHAAVPICAPGLAVLMTPALLIDREWVFLVVPLFAGLLVWSVFALGRALDDEATGLGAALLTACSPIVLYQAVQPMSDIPAAALWLAAFVFCLPGTRTFTVLAGLTAALAVLVRPNLVVLAILLPALLRNGDSRHFGNGDSRHFRRGKWRLSPFLWFAAGGAPVAIAMLAINAARYGSPLASGYGSTDALFAWTHVAPNLARYPRWLLETHSPIVLLALAGPWLLWRRGRGVEALVAITAILLTVATYLAYTVFDDWWYLRFLLPALPLVLIFVAATLRAIAGRTIAMAICALLAGWYLDVAHDRQAFALAGLESRFRITAAHAARAFPEKTVVFTVQQSGALRYYAGIPTLLWDSIDPGALDVALAGLRARGYTPLLALEDAEAGPFRARFAAQMAGQLDWPPMVEVHAPVRVRVYDPVQAARFRGGATVETEHVWK